MDTCNVDDVVQLKSGGPKMTVDQADGNDIRCIWFDGQKKVGDYFNAAVLKHVEVGENENPRELDLYSLKRDVSVSFLQQSPR